MKHSLKSIFLAGLAILTSTAVSRAAVLTWDGGGADGKWSTATNWPTAATPAATGDTLVFADTLNTSTTNDIPSITLSASGSPITFAAGAGSFTLAGNADGYRVILGNAGTGSATAGTAVFRGILNNSGNLNIATQGGARNLAGSSLALSGGARVTNDGADNLALANLINGDGNKDFWITGTGGVTLGGGIFLTTSQMGRQLYINLTGTTSMTVNGAVADTFHSGGLTTGTSTLRKASGGTLRLNGNSAYTALTQVDAGVLLVNGTHAPTANSQRYLIASTGILGGTGMVKPFDTSASLTALSVSGTLSPGDPLVNHGLGTLTLDGSNSARSLLALETGAKLQIDLMTDTSDQIAILGATGSNEVFFNDNVVNFVDLTGILPAGDYM